jgi:hypothetical protein
MKKLTPAQQRIAGNWPLNTFHAARVKSYGDSRVMFRAAAALGLEATYSGSLFITHPKPKTPAEEVLFPAARCQIRRVLQDHHKQYTWGRPSDADAAHKRKIVREFCPIALPAYDLARHNAFV